MMSEQSDVILTPNSYDDGFLERWLDRVLWGYPKLVDACPFSILAVVRKQKIEEREKSAKPIPAIHLETDTDAQEEQHPELPGGGNITRDPILPPSSPLEDQASTNEIVHPISMACTLTRLKIVQKRTPRNILRRAGPLYRFR